VTSEDRTTYRRRRTSGWLATLLGAGFLVLLGFAVGMVVGASVEDPDLIASVVAGQAQEVKLPPEDTIADRLGDPAEQASRPFGAARSEPMPPPVAAAPPPEKRRVTAGGFSIQVGAFREESPAQGLVRQLESGGFKTYIATSDEGSGQRWRVRVGPVASRGEADELARRLKRDEGLPTWVVADE
jgi:cell division septation protein DedD